MAPASPPALMRRRLRRSPLRNPDPSRARRPRRPPKPLPILPVLARRARRSAPSPFRAPAATADPSILASSHGLRPVFFLTLARSLLLATETRIALVTGASRGIGRAIATRLAKDGRHVVLVSRTAGPLSDLQSQIQAA